MRRAGRKDLPQAAIVDALRAIGVVVRVVNQEGLPDLLVATVRPIEWKGFYWYPIEVKQPREALTAPQQELYDMAPFPIVHSVEETLALWGVA